MLLQRSLEIAKQENFSSIWLGVWHKNEKAIQLYKRYGFEYFGNYHFIMGTVVSEDYLFKKMLS